MAKASDFNLCKVVGPWMSFAWLHGLWAIVAVICVIEASILGESCSSWLLDVFVIACGIHTAFYMPIGSHW